MRGRAGSRTGSGVSLLIQFSMSAFFVDECTRLTFSFVNRYQDIGSSDPVKSLMFRVQLNPISNVVFSPEYYKS